ncbi:MAG: hypothetical protein V7609_3132 [Verrucomicrobiota bacterium]
MIGIADFYLPVVRPPKKFLTDPLSYYSAIEGLGVNVIASSQAPGAPMEITVENPEVTHPDSDIPMSTVFAATTGFVSYLQGDVVLRVWGPDFDDLVKPEDGLRPNRIAYSLLDAASVQEAIENQIAKLPLPVLKESWTESGAGIPPDDSDALESALVQRFMAGTASIFVAAGTPLGRGSTAPGVNGDVAQLTLTPFFDPWGPTAAVSVPPEDLVDSALAVLRLPKFAGHPLIKAINAIINVHFQSRFLIWDNGIFDYVPFANGMVTLLAGAPLPAALADLIPTVPVATAPTDGAGQIDLTVPLPARAMISFRYATTNKTYGNRLFVKDIETDPHKARLNLDTNFNNTKDYKAKHEIFPDYQAFLEDIADQDTNEVFGEDRGNASWQDRKNLLEMAAIVVPDYAELNAIFTQRDRLRQISAFESFYKAEVIRPKAKTFNLLCEGDSWLNYPLAFNDIYGHLDQIFWSRLKPDIAYNRIPLQHLGDRSDHMFLSQSGKVRQWNFTEDFLAEYQIDLILCSAGGNDFAEPGISNSFKTEPYKSFLTDGSFNPFAAQGSLTASEMAAAKKLMQQSFAVLLRNHRWNFFLQNPSGTQLDETAMEAALTPLLAAVGTAFGPTPAMLQAMGVPPGSVSNAWAPMVLQPIGSKVIANFPDTYSPGSPAEALLHFVFDMGSITGLWEQRYAQVKTLWQVLLTKTQGLGIPVVSHTYGYPLFNENPASYLGWGNTNITGPWFNHRFREANITDRRIQKICLKAIVDNFVNVVFNPLKLQYPLFDYVDIRNLNSATDLWRDEMHLRATGYKKIAEKIYETVAANPNLSHFFET